MPGSGTSLSLHYLTDGRVAVEVQGARGYSIPPVPPVGVAAEPVLACGP